MPEMQQELLYTTDWTELDTLILSHDLLCLRA